VQIHLQSSKSRINIEVLTAQRCRPDSCSVFQQCLAVGLVLGIIDDVWLLRKSLLYDRTVAEVITMTTAAVCRGTRSYYTDTSKTNDRD
jgi:hypothetical protein